MGISHSRSRSNVLAVLMHGFTGLHAELGFFRGYS